jgi:hypothetical protein
VSACSRRQVCRRCKSGMAGSGRESYGVSLRVVGALKSKSKPACTYVTTLHPTTDDQAVCSPALPVRPSAEFRENGE